jgi:hypothetical protein
MTRRQVARVLLAAAFACSEPIEAPPDARFRIEPAAQWSGGWVQVHSPALATAATAVVTVVGDTVSLETSRVADTTLAVRLPDVSGSVQLRLQLDRWPFQLDPIEVYGYTDAREIPAVMDGDLLVWPRNGYANVLAGTPDGVALLQANTGQVRTFPGTGQYGFLYGVRGPGVTYQDGVFALLPVYGSPVELWRLLPSATRVSADSGVTAYRQAMRLNSGTWLVTSHHYMDLVTWSDSLGRYERSWSIQAEETEGVLMSPRHDRATVLVDWAMGGDGVPVFDASAGTVAYRVPGMERVAGADFSADGEWLALAGGGHIGGVAATNRLILLRAATGDVVWDTVLDRRPFGVTLDAFAPLMYVGLSDLDVSPGDGLQHPVVLVFARETGRLLAELRPPAAAPGCFFGDCYKAVIARSAEPALYVVWGYQGETWVWRFAMLPAVLTEGGGETP